MSVFKTVPGPDSRLEVVYSDDDASRTKVFVCRREASNPHSPFAEIGEALARGTFGSFAGGTHRLNEGEAAFLESLREEAARFTWAMNIAVFEGADHAEADAARAVLRAVSPDAEAVFDRLEQGCRL